MPLLFSLHGEVVGDIGKHVKHGGKGGMDGIGSRRSLCSRGESSVS
jgi:hypothetical protein